MRSSFDLSFYLVIGPENTLGRDFRVLVRQAIQGGITFLQVRSKIVAAREWMELGRIAAAEIAQAGRQDALALVINDRVDVAQALRLAGVKVDGVHLGQSDIPTEAARRILGEDAIIGLSARAQDLFAYIEDFNTGIVDYFGAGPLRQTETKPDCGLVDGKVLERDFAEIKRLKTLSPLPVVFGGGVKEPDLAALQATGVDGFFVVSAIASADDPLAAAQRLRAAWR
ncbi:MAG: thiamine phosphate synthase [Peptococcaceae bacterium]|jgi:thiamine-phosphate diphosphorylase|nr:thiamine phosphate synthase [Peptococcaceae bacterium]